MLICDNYLLFYYRAPSYSSSVYNVLFLFTISYILNKQCVNGKAKQILWENKNARVSDIHLTLVEVYVRRTETTTAHSLLFYSS